MALIKCKECGNEISNKAKECPQCGAPVGKKQYNMGLGGCLVIILMMAGVGSLIGNADLSPPPLEEGAVAKRAKATAEKERIAEIPTVAKFGAKPVASPWDGSYSEVDTYLKKILNDSDSLKIDGCTVVSVAENGWQVGCDYRAKNAFGGWLSSPSGL